MNYESAELTKISINIFLASTVTTTNMLARASEKTNADWRQIIPAIQLDKRIGKFAYLKPGLGLSGGNIERDLFSIKTLMKNDYQGKKFLSSIIDNSKYMSKWVQRIVKKKINKKSKIGILGKPIKIRLIQ